MSFRNIVLAASTLVAAAAVAAPQYNVDLEGPQYAIRGKALTLDAIGPANTRLMVVASEADGTIAPLCPPALNGDCLDVTSNFTHLGSINTNVDGEGRVTFMVPEKGIADYIVIQSGTATNVATWFSNPVYIEVLDGDADADGDGFSNGKEVALGMDPFNARF